MRLGVLGGTFDPIHQGHLDVARAARHALKLDAVWLLPAARPSHRSPPAAGVGDRLAMARLAAAEAGLTVSDVDAREPVPSFTWDALDRLAEAGVDLGQVFFLTGADAFASIRTWKAYPALLDRCHFGVVSRPGFPVSRLREALPELAGRLRPPPRGDDPPSVYLIDAETADVASTDVRRRVAAGESIEGLVPAAVAHYIGEHALYGAP